MKINPLGSYYALVAKYNKYFQQLQKSIRDKSFYRYTLKKRRVLLKRLRKLERKLKSLRPELGLKQAPAALSLAAVLAAASPTLATERFEVEKAEVALEAVASSLSLSNNTVSLNAVVGTVVGTLSGGTTYDLQQSGDAQDDHNSFFTVDGSNRLRVNADLKIAGSSTLNIYIEGTSFTITIDDYPSIEAPISTSGVAAQLPNGPQGGLVDVDGDGDLDAFAVTGSYLYQYNFDTGAEYFTDAGNSTSIDFYAAQPIDLDGDGDIEVVQQYNGYIEIFDDMGVGVISASTNLSTAYALAVGDIDGDGDLDVIVGQSDRFTVLQQGSSDLFFAASVSLSERPQEFALADLDADGDLDILVGGDYSIDIFENESGSFSATASYNVATGSYLSYSSYYSYSERNYILNGAALGDVDGDGDIDIIVSQFGYNNFHSQYETSGFYFNVYPVNVYPAYNFSGYTGYLAGANLADIDADGDLDIISFGGYGDRVMENTGGNDFQYSGSFYFDQNSTIADIDGDGVQDVLSGGGGVIFFGEASANPTSISFTQNSDPFPKVGSQLGVFTVVDPDSSDPEISLVSGAGDDDNHLFAITRDFSTGNRTLVVKHDILALARNSFNVRVEANDGSGGVLEEAISIMLASPTAIQDFNTVSVSFSGNNVDIGLADMDNDQDLDLFLSNFNTPGYLLENDGIQPFSTGNSFSFGIISVGTNTYSGAAERVALGDVDGDGDVDAVLTDKNGNLSIVQADNELQIVGTTAMVVFGLDHSVKLNDTNQLDVAVGDLDGDGDLEQISIDYGAISVFSYSDVSQNFQLSATYVGGGTEVEVADMDGDGDLDVIANGQFRIRVFENDGSGGLSLSNTDHNINSGGYSNRVEFSIGDIDGDGDIDAVFGPSQNSPNNVWVMDNDGSGGLTSPISQSFGLGTGGPASVSELNLVDFDGDGDLDIALANPNASNYLLLNDGSGNFSLSTQNIGSQAQSLDFGDLDGDGDLDMVAGRYGSTIIYYGTPPITPPTAIGLTGSDDIFEKKIGEVIRTIDVTDGDQASGHTLRLVSGSGDDDNALFTISGSDLILNADISGHQPTVKSFTVRIEAEDDDTNTFQDELIVQAAAAPGASAPGTFIQATNAVGFSSQTYTASTGDFDNDGDLDLFLGGNYQFAILSNVGTTSGNFNQYTFSSNYSIYRSEVADMDGDGDLDVVVLNDAGEVQVLANNGTLGFIAGSRQYIRNAYNIEVGDLDGDGDIDVFVVAPTVSNAVLSNDGSLNFTTGNTFSNSAEIDAKLADADGDGDLDAIMVGGSGTHYIQYNDGSGAFGSAASFSGNDSPFNIELADLDGDADLDIVVGRSFGSNGTSDLFFVDGNSISLATMGFGTGETKDVGIADFDGDGDLELIDATFNTGGNYVYGFTSAGADIAFFSSLDGTGSAYAVVTGDFDNDGDIDIFMANRYQDVLYLNDAVAPSDVYLSNNMIDAQAGIGIEIGDLTNSATSGNFAYTLVSGDGDDHNGFFTIDGDVLRVNSNLAQLGLTTANIRVEVEDLDLSVSSEHELTIEIDQPTEGFAFFASQAIGTHSSNAASPNNFELGDLDGDGDLDVVVGGASYLQLWANDGYGNLTDATPYTVGTTATTYAITDEASDVRLADMDGDGDLDIIVADNGGAEIRLYTNNGLAGYFSLSSQQIGSNSSVPESIELALGDVDDDGDVDIIVSYQFATSSDVHMLENGTAGFSSAAITSTGYAINDVELGDLDGDGDLDFAYTAYNYTYIFENTGGGNFVYQAYAYAAGRLELADVDGDGDLDVLTAGYDDNAIDYRVRVQLNQGSFDFSVNGADLYLGYADDLTTADIDGDGDLDLIVGSSSTYYLTVLENTGVDPDVSVSFSLQQELGSTYYMNRVEAGDMDGDGDVDFVAFNTSYPFSGRIAFNVSTPSDIFIGFVDSEDIDIDTPIGTILGAFNVTDEGSSTHTTELVAGDGDDHNGLFTINNGNLVVNAPLNLDLGITEFKIRVKATNDDGGTYEEAFTISASGGVNEPSPGAFALINQITSGAPSVNELAFADLDDDGDEDMIINASMSTEIWLNDGDGNFTPQSSYGWSYETKGLAVADLDSDGDLDLVVSDDSYFHILKNDGSAGFSANYNYGYSDSYGYGDPAVGDMDNDGDIDIFLTNYYSGYTYVWENLGGTFDYGAYTSIGGYIQRSFNTELDSDGDLDPVMISSNRLYVAEGDHDQVTNGSGLSYSCYGLSNVTDGAIGDLDGDGDIDVLIVSDSYNALLYANDGSGGFSGSAISRILISGGGSYSVTSSASSYADRVALGDVDGDGDLDMFISGYYDNTVSENRMRVFLNDGSAGFSESVALGDNDLDGAAIALSDIDGDGDLDAISYDSDNSYISFFVNNNAPTISAAATTISESIEDGATVFSSTGEDQDADELTFTITSGNGDGIFAINESSGRVTIADNSDIDFETTTSYTLTIQVSDGVASASADFTVNVSNTNEAPVLTVTDASIPEDADVGTVVSNPSATDEDGNTLTYSITNGNEDGVFAIDEDTGEVTVADNSTLDFETTESYDLTIEVSDGAITDSETLTVTITDVNESPVLTVSDASIPEDADEGTKVSNPSATADTGETLTYSITSGNDDGVFAIDEDTGEITVADNSNLDFEMTESYDLTVQVSDGTATDTETLTVSITNVNEAPSVTDETFTIDELSADGTVVGQVTASDPDGDDLTYRISDVGDSGNFFRLNNDGSIEVQEGRQLIFDAQETYTFTVKVTDEDGLFDTGTITVNLTQVFLTQVVRAVPPANASIPQDFPDVLITAFEVDGEDLIFVDDEISFIDIDDPVSFRLESGIGYTIRVEPIGAPLAAVIQTTWFGDVPGELPEYAVFSPSAVDIANGDEIVINLQPAGSETTLSVGPEGEAQVRVYPNPVDQKVRMELADGYRGQVEVAIISLDGKTVFEEVVDKRGDVLLLDRELSFEAGVYTITFRLGDRVVTRRLIKN